MVGDVTVSVNTRNPCPFRSRWVSNCGLIAAKTVPRTNPSNIDHYLRAVWIVERQHRGLREGVGCPKAGGVFGVALDLRWTPLMTLHHDPVREPAQGHRRGKK